MLIISLSFQNHVVITNIVMWFTVAEYSRLILSTY